MKTRDRLGKQKWSRYVIERTQRIKREYLQGKACSRCGRTDGVVPTHPEGISGIWTWSKVRRDTRLAESTPLCQDCRRETGHFRRSSRYSRSARYNEAVELYRAGLTPLEICDKFRILDPKQRERFRAHLADARLTRGVGPHRPRPGLPVAVKAEVHRLAAQGLSLREIAGRLDIDYKQVWEVLRRKKRSKP